MEESDFDNQKGSVGHVPKNVSSKPPEFLTPTIHPSPHYQLEIRTNPVVLLDVEYDDFSLYNYYLSKEKECGVVPTYITTVQKSIGFENRHKATEIMFWLHKAIHHRFDRTFVLAMRMFDRFLSIKSVPNVRDLYRLCITCVFTAGKTEECYLCYGISDIFELCKKDLGIHVFGYTLEEFLKAESGILKMLDFRLSLPTLYDFVSIMSEHIHVEQRKLIRFLTVSASAEYCLHRFDLSVLGLGIVLLSEMIWNDWAWESFDHFNICQSVWKKNKEVVLKCARILWSLIHKRHFDIIIKIFEKENCIRKSKNNSVSKVFFEWSKKVMLFEAQKYNNNNEGGIHNNINDNDSTIQMNRTNGDVNNPTNSNNTSNSSRRKKRRSRHIE